ncbi:MAG TPA: RluA family pseudouridine synthase [Rhabdochlamydiaceae bacterium]|jgi:RluA family pseudouridine synthase
MRKADPSSCKWRVSAKEAGMSLLSFLREKNELGVSVKALKRAVDGKCCAVNGHLETFSSHRLEEGDVVTLRHLPPSRPKKMPLTVLFEDQDLLFVDKPAGLICENRYFAPLIQGRAHLIHRLDKETSGVVMLGKNKEIIEEMIALFRKKQIRKYYLALVDGCIREEKGKMQSGLKKEAKRQATFREAKGRGAADALTLWKCLGRSQTASLLLCEPITGRTHQLRVHLNGIGHPILGDTHYGKRFRCTLKPLRHFLHAQRIAFVHPKTQSLVDVVAPLPLDFEQGLGQLGISWSSHAPF